MTIQEKIRQRRRQMLVHSYIYYELNDNIVSDVQWSKWAKELQELQEKYPKESSEVEDYEQFKDWDGSSGAFLNFSEAIKTVAKILLGIKSPSLKIANSKPLILNSEKKLQKSKSNLKSDTRKLF